MECIKKNAIINEYVVARALLVLLVLIGHCSYFDVITPYGGITYFLNSKYVGTSVSSIIKYMNLCTFLIYTFHMPMFFFVTGALFNYGLIRGKYTIPRVFVKNKFNKLIIVFILVSIFYSIPIRYISDYFNNSENLLKDIIIGELLIEGNTYLWFLPTLFITYIIFYLLRNVINKKTGKIILLILFSLLMFITVQIKIIDNVNEKLLYFYLGMLFEEKRDYINGKINKIICVLLFILWFVCSLILFTVQRKLSSFTDILLLIKVFELFVTLLGISFFYSFCFIHSTELSNKKSVLYLNTNCIYIYIAGEPINILCLKLYNRIRNGINFSNSVDLLVLYIIRILIPLIVGIFLSEIIKRIKFYMLNRGEYGI